MSEEYKAGYKAGKSGKVITNFNGQRLDWLAGSTDWLEGFVDGALARAREPEGK